MNRTPTVLAAYNAPDRFDDQAKVYVPITGKFEIDLNKKEL